MQKQGKIATFLLTNVYICVIMSIVSYRTKGQIGCCNKAVCRKALTPAWLLGGRHLLI